MTKRVSVVSGLLMLAGAAFAQNPIHVTYLWHMHQPIYYPRLGVTDTDNSGLFSFNVRSVFDTRTGPYTTWPDDAVQQGADRGMPHAGVQVSFTGSLMEDLNGIWATNWQASYRWGRNQLRTANNNPRLDLVGMAYHHSLMPLTSRETMRMQIRLHRAAYIDNWNTGGTYSKGFFPPESSFENRMIPALVSEGIQWVLVDNGHIDRTLEDFPWSSSSSVRPNRADQRNGSIANWNSQWTALQNIWAPTPVAAPFSYQPRRIRYVDPWSDPASPTVYSMIAVPAGRYEGNENARGGYGAFKPENVWGMYASRNNNPNRPMIIVCHSDGDNFGMLNSDAYHAQHGLFLDMVQSNASFAHSTVQDYLDMYPVPANDPYIHVESGSWIGIDGGTPYFYKWLENNAVNGEHPDYWSWSVLIAAMNRVLHAESLEGNYTIDDVRAGTNSAGTPLAWYHYLNAEASDYWYWDFDRNDPWDGNVTRACNLSATEADKVIARHPGVDTVGPSIFHPQRSTWNPGGKLWTESTNQPSDFSVWTFVDDVSGVANVRLYWRTADWNSYTNLNDFAQEIYAHTPSKNSDWTIVPMTGAWYPSVKGPLVPDPLHRAQQYTGSIIGQTQALVSYFVEAVDTVGNTNRSDIFHVWVGDATGGGGGGGGGNTNACVGRACVSPAPPVQGYPVTISYSTNGSPIAAANPIRIHLGWNNWASVITPDPAMTFNAASNLWQFTTNVPAGTTELECDFNDGSTWDNNGGAGVDYRFAVVSNSVPQAPPTPTGFTATAVSTNQINLSWSASSGATGYSINRAGSPLATTSATSYSDVGLTTNTAYCYTVAATNSVGASAATAAQCATTLSVLQAPATPAGLMATPVSTNQINLAWSASTGAASYWVSRDSAAVGSTTSTSYSDIGLAANSSHCYSVIASNSTGVSAASATVCTNTYAVVTNLPPFMMDGAFDSAGYRVASNGMVLYAALRGTTLYVATWSPGTSGPNDHFIFVSDQLLASASAAAPWGKAGSVAVATTKPYLASESLNTYISWYNNGAATSWPCAKSATNSGAMEGTLDLVAAFGSVPANIYLCAAAYITTNGGTVVAQCPAGSGPNIDMNEFLVIPTSALRDSWGNGTLDLCDPARGFKILGSGVTPGGTTVNWASMPGRSYQVLYAGLPNSAWTNLAGGSNFAGPLQLSLSCTDAPPSAATQRFYRVKLLP